MVNAYLFIVCELWLINHIIVGKDKYSLTCTITACPVALLPTRLRHHLSLSPLLVSFLLESSHLLVITLLITSIKFVDKVLILYSEKICMNSHIFKQWLAGNETNLHIWPTLISIYIYIYYVLWNKNCFHLTKKNLNTKWRFFKISFVRYT